jgi:hypothetical protein
MLVKHPQKTKRKKTRKSLSGKILSILSTRNFGNPKKRAAKTFSGKKGSAEESLNILLGLFILVVVVGFVFYMIAVSVDKYEEQTFMNTVGELAYSMDYVCSNNGITEANPLTVNVAMPQKVGEASSWIAGFGDPKYLVYYERFPVNEDWAWTTLRLVNPWEGFAETAAIGVVVTSLPYVGQLSKTGIVKKVGSALWGKAKSGISRMISDGFDMTSESIGRKFKGYLYTLSGGIELKNANKNFDKLTRDIVDDIPDAIRTDRVLVKTAGQKALTSTDLITSKTDDLIAEIPNMEGSTDDLANVLLSDKKLYNDADMTSELAIIDKKIASNDESPEIMAKIQDYRNSLAEHKKLMDEYPWLFKALKSMGQGIDLKQLPRNVILNAAANKGNWIGKNYYFDAVLSPLDRANQKFQDCGANALCAKTPNYIAVFPLQKCAYYDINYVQLKLDGGKPVPGPFAIPTAWFNIWTSGTKRFYLASPCGMKFNIYRSKCNCLTTTEPVIQLNFKEEDGGYFEPQTVGAARVCDESTGQEQDTSAALSGKLSQVDCLVVKPDTSQLLDGYGGDDKAYNNFCFSRPKEVLKFTENAILGISTLADIGLMLLAPESAGLSLLAIDIVNNLASDMGNRAAYSAALWPNS